MTARKPPIDKACAFCGETFVCTRKFRTYCSEVCYKAMANKRSTERYYKAHPPEKTKTVKCPYCKVSFETKRYKIYCCTEHRLLADRKRLRAKTPEDKKRALKQQGWTLEERRAYGLKYYREVILPREKLLQEEDDKAFAKIAPPRIPPMHLQSLSPEQIAKYWNMIG